jgi:dihydrofolate reductase
MSTIRLYMSISVDGFIAGPDDTVDAPMGDGGFRLFGWPPDAPGANTQVYGEAMATKAVIAGRRTYEHAHRWNGDHHDGVPVFILTHAVPDEPAPGSVVYVTDATEAAERARAAVGDGTVLVHGAGAAQALLRAGQIDELELHVAPVLLGQGRRLFDDLPPDHVELELVRTLDGVGVRHVRYRVVR